MKKYIPNCLSVLNLISGAIGTLLALNGHLVYAGYSIFIGACFDFLDGFVAKLLCAQSAFGKQLDALADLITFGMLPGAILYMLIKTYESCPYRPYAALLIVVFAALRLAKFNVDPKQVDRFIGLPTPASAIIVATLPIMLARALYPHLVHGLTQPLVLPLLTMLLSYLLVSNIPFLAFKFQGFSFQANRSRYFLIALGALLIAAMHIEGLFCSVWLYILYALCSAKKR
ncbi:MAG: CDP-diacylglycerol--serine O-phosphatidyltransferase [Candidatus Cardinium sp.]|uniref:CDP-diacylglycerol--serine O-phosphatidyltransferase n=1 Tax=Cardinium endosymbiont of Dermatophagoides farinae TaxID=2597823 RepID=UPI001183CB2B|nr:CDP-diacylglycerol--serine O-phosphatidyltransferase [Cardinium endosymbiont of Dermatophagoides farinae]TSJ81427.1 CDP-diacylglycerol--serine O-phosphatidyltransferase [Cardinium endosymbiont of Dermatophagoides farinae]UWW97489.1 MAG: CDP-diacylglycerol--serine O-phosphatidyltransferase [Candidatus Cardinium sp.]